MAIRIVRLGNPRVRDEGLRIGTVRRLPRGVKKQDYARRDFFDVWFPELAPSAKLVKSVQGKDVTDAQWRKFAAAYRREMGKPPASRTLDVLARLSESADFSVGCYCEDYSRCHRSILKELLAEHGANVAENPPEKTR